MDEVHVTFNENKQYGYKMNFNIITFHKTYDSNVSSTKAVKPGKNLESSYCSWMYGAKNQHIHLKEKPVNNAIKIENISEDIPAVESLGIRAIQYLEPSKNQPRKFVRQTSSGKLASHAEIVESTTSLVSPANIHPKESDHEIEEAPYCTFSLSMDKVRYTSFKFKVWED